MEKNAMTAGVAPGGLISTTQIRALICYIFNAIPDPVPGQKLADMLFYEGLANCFEGNDSIAFLEKQGHIQLVDKAEDTYTITPTGRSIAKTLGSDVPFTVRERAYTIALQLVSRIRNAKETDISISSENGTTYITCSAHDGEKPFDSVKLLVSDEAQARFIQEKFIDDPTKIYSGIIDLLTK